MMKARAEAAKNVPAAVEDDQLAPADIAEDTLQEDPEEEVQTLDDAVPVEDEEVRDVD